MKMEKIVKIGKTKVKLSNNIGWAFIYKDQFGQDIIPSLMPALMSIVDVMGALFKSMDGAGPLSAKDAAKVLDDETALTDALIHLSGLEFTDFLNITWSLAKAADDEIDPPREWVKQFDSFPLDEVAPAVFELIFSGVASSKNVTRLKDLMKSLQPTKTGSPSN